ncbi:MAG: T9SS type A sorting domain-containing protein [Flavobacteriales bacterium]|jgi:hypothetical protein|nr:T9SS type A sorting domain-containing protein [Flavobacteriales bacterium]MBK6551034.1 T9SS type A sorting domain-containing protein [Flavobacteriales bacterium]MBK6882591.1 T9SS type A sorting domain-containing protein [Flavobacteriales bacterium]MBK7101177.1 T9SS type A sorting domain-containing protein [Flavobacteriales bacterium]MBK7111898.1 T9SS type A sorting domain-containing protein [Flavobacteriales bacterium]
MHKFFLCSLFGSLALGSHAQTMELPSGTMTIHSGTTLRLESPMTWVLGPDVTLVNDGVIDLGAESILAESAGAPITGTGFERVSPVALGPFDGEEPGGLGLTVTTTSTAGPLVLERSHTPFVLPEGDGSIARSYRIQSPLTNGAAMDLDLRYDPSELNGLDPMRLALFRSPDEIGPWVLLTSTSSPGMNLVSATDLAPWALLTAFDVDAPTGVASMVAEDAFVVWPTVVTDLIHVGARHQGSIRTIEVLDPLGRVIEQDAFGAQDRATLHLGHLAIGTYFLRVNGSGTFKFRRL